MNEQQQTYPRLEKIYGGKWAARGPGWAVHGATQQEAIANYRAAERRHAEIMERPPLHEQRPEKEENERDER